MAETYSLSFHTIGQHNYAATELETGYSLQKTIMVISIPICILGLLGNAIIFCLLCCSIKKTNFTVYFLNLVVADFVVLIYYVIVFILFLKAVPISLYSLNIMELAHAFGFNAKTYVLTAITAERYVMVFSPAWYQLHRPKHFSEIMCTILWVLSGLLAIILYYSCYLETDTLLMEANHHCEPTKMARVIINLLVFLPIMVFSTYLIFTRMLSVSQETPLRRLDITIVATVLLFLIFAASVRIIEIIARWVPKIHIPILFLILHFLDAIDSSGNPYVYLIVGYSKTPTDCEKPLQTLLERALLDDGTTEM
ncbi:mas-related G-protein coupled receptor member H-like [Protobothrops mucrosquamatus]|uniref:mas-related G-protein coupled receptor member H-like n=1 Tax=Protobothrops mucrosquamatus TaxID=103944 RepID=UPI000775D65B|nr:mas-related G-protein coupled receptor member H-like [Protobothrops mucrosquamatus]